MNNPFIFEAQPWRPCTCCRPRPVPALFSDWEEEARPALAKFGQRQPLENAVRTAPAGGGVYVIYKGGAPLYVGQSEDLKRRFQQHWWCVTHLFRPDERPAFQVSVMPLPKEQLGERKKVESWLIGKWKRPAPKKQWITNVKKEVEELLWEGGWY